MDELERVYLGSYELMHTLDLYPEDEEERPHIVGEETVHISLLAHPRSHMYIVMLFIPNCRYSTSQLEDQVCQKFLQIRNKGDQDENGFYQYWNLNEWLKKEYGLLQCGTGKSILSMSKKPEQEQEFYNILTGESYNSMRQEFHIVYDKLKHCAANNRAIYDYYEVYLTEEVVAFVLNDFEEMDADEFAQFACKYASEIDCSIVDKSLLALYERIEMMEEDGVRLTRKAAVDLIEEAADKAEKQTFGRKLMSFVSPMYDKEGYLILREKDFFD